MHISEDTPSGPAHLEDAAALAERKEGRRVAVCLPALNEAATIGSICQAVKQNLMSPSAHPLVDELWVLHESDDDTPQVAAEAGAKVAAVSDLLPELGPGQGKGDALWKAMAVTAADFIVYCDADLLSFSPDHITRLLAPLLGSGSHAGDAHANASTSTDTSANTSAHANAGENGADTADAHANAAHANAAHANAAHANAGENGAEAEEEIVLVKGCYQRWLDDKPEGGGRNTELVARPLLSIFFPELSHVRQPLSGEYAVRRSSAMQVPFVQGYGVEVGLLIDLSTKFGAASIVSVDLGIRRHRNRPLHELSPQALEIMHVILERAGVKPPSGSWETLLRGEGSDGEGSARTKSENRLVSLRERPPMENFCWRERSS